MKNCIVCLDLTNFDEHILKSCKNVIQPLLKYDNFEFINVVTNLVHPQQEIHQIIDYTGPQTDLESKVKKIMESKVKRIINPLGISNQYTVLEGRPYRELIHRIDVKQADLVVVGCKSRSSNSGITPKRIAHNLNSDILFVPESKGGKIKNILVPVDFSDNSLKAVQIALEIAPPNSKVNVLHVVSPIYSYAMASSYVNEYNAMLLDNSKDTMNKFIAKLGQDIPDKLGVTLLKGSQFSVADTIKDYAEQNNSDLLILGARSHGKFRNFIIGSTTESLIHLRPNIPILIKR